jgi:predicted RNase H-like nuclease (RuvC/YqgF family)
MIGRVLNDEDLLQTEQTWDAIQFVDVEYAKQTVRNLIATVRDRDRQISALQTQLDSAWESKRVMAGKILDHEETIRRLDTRVKERDRTIEELQHELNETLKREKKALQIGISYKNQNALMLETLEQALERCNEGATVYTLSQLLRDTLAKVRGGDTNATT